MTTSEAEQRAMRRALTLAVTPGVPLGPNPRVGCVLLAPDGTTVAEGFHRGAGTSHAEAAALAEAGAAARGTTAVVTLEPCNHTGRTRMTYVRRHLRALPIRTLTVGPGVTPGQPVTGCDRVADFHRRLGITPTPEHASI